MLYRQRYTTFRGCRLSRKRLICYCVESRTAGLVSQSVIVRVTETKVTQGSLHSHVYDRLTR